MDLRTYPAMQPAPIWQPLPTQALLVPRAANTTSTSGTGDQRPPVYKAVGISLAIASGVFIGTSFVLKKTGLLKANVKYNEEAGEGYGYLKNAFWWSGMTLMIIGEICNFVAYAFVDAILVTPLGALSVVITTILSAIFLKERLSFVGKVGCFMCIVGSVVIVLNAPAQSSAGTIQEMQHYVISPGFLSYAGVVIVGAAFTALWVGPRYGKKSMLVYLSVCSWIGGLSVVATQGLGAAVVAQAAGKPQFNQWFLYVLLVFVISTLLTEIVFLNKALNIYNAALVTPTYYVYFTSATIITSAILFQGFHGTPASIITVVLGFLTICSGVVLLQLSKSAKDVPDAAVFKGDLDQVRTVAEQEEPETEPKADAIRGTAAIIRRISNARQRAEASEARRVHEDRMRDQMEPIGENEQVEWDGLRRRKTVRSSTPGTPQRTKTIHPPLGMTHFPDDADDFVSADGSTHRSLSRSMHGSASERGSHSHFHGGFFDSFRRNNQREDSLPGHSRSINHAATTTAAVGAAAAERQELPKRPFTEIVTPANLNTSVPPSASSPMSASADPNAMELTGHVYGLQRSPSITDGRAAARPIMWADSVDHPPRTGTGASHDSTDPPPPPMHASKRAFSFQNPFGSRKSSRQSPSSALPPFPPPFAAGGDASSDDNSSSARPHGHRHHFGIGHRRGSQAGAGQQLPTKTQQSHRHVNNKFLKTATEEERLGLVKGDSNASLVTGSRSASVSGGSGSGDEMLGLRRGTGGAQQGYDGTGAAGPLRTLHRPPYRDEDDGDDADDDDDDGFYNDSSGWEHAQRRGQENAGSGPYHVPPNAAAAPAAGAAVLTAPVTRRPVAVTNNSYSGRSLAGAPTTTTPTSTNRAATPVDRPSHTRTESDLAAVGIRRVFSPQADAAPAVPQALIPGPATASSQPGSPTPRQGRRRRDVPPTAPVPAPRQGDDSSGNAGFEPPSSFI